jgi:hypothetical protein
MRIRVVVKDKQIGNGIQLVYHASYLTSILTLIDVQCGEGTQTLKWLAAAALCRYDSNFGIHLGIFSQQDREHSFINAMFDIGVPRGLRLEDASPLTMSAAIKDTLRDGTQVFLLLSKGSCCSSLLRLRHDTPLFTLTRRATIDDENNDVGEEAKRDHATDGADNTTAPTGAATSSSTTVAAKTAAASPAPAKRSSAAAAPTR